MFSIGSHGLVAVVWALEAKAWLGAQGWTGKRLVRSCGELGTATGVRFVIAEDPKPHTQLPFLLSPRWGFKAAVSGLLKDSPKVTGSRWGMGT